MQDLKNLFRFILPTFTFHGLRDRLAENTNFVSYASTSQFIIQASQVTLNTSVKSGTWLTASQRSVRVNFFFFFFFFFFVRPE